MKRFRDMVWLAGIAALAFYLDGICACRPQIVEVDSRQYQALKAPRVAFNGRDRLFLVVWEYHYGKTDWDIDGCILDAAGRPVGDPFGADRWRL